MNAKRLIIGLLCLFALLVAIGISVVSLFRSSVLTTATVTTSNDPRSYGTPSPEFTKPEVDEEGSGPRLVFSSVMRGKSAICRSEKPSFSNRSGLVLFRRGETFTLERTPLTIGNLAESETSAIFPVEFRGSRDALFLLSENGSLKPGPVHALYIEPWNSDVPGDKLFFDGLRIGDSRSFQLGEKKYTIRVSTGPSQPAGPVAVLVLETPGQKQIIWYGSIFDAENEIGELEWVGDLDGDERIDLLFRYFESNGGGSVDVMLLSSYAKPNSFVGPAAISFARDCR